MKLYKKPSSPMQIFIDKLQYFLRATEVDLIVGDFNVGFKMKHLIRRCTA